MSEPRGKILQLIALPGGGLGFFRQGLGLLCVLDACLRLPDFSFMLSDLGVLPRSLYFRIFEDSLAWSVYSVSGRPEVALFLLLVTIGLGLFQLVGRGRSPRWTRVCLWLLVLSVQNRNPALVDSSDELLRLMLFWDIFLPDQPEAQGVVGPATLGLQAQLTLGFVLLSWYTTSESWSQAAVWSLNSLAFQLPWLWIPVKITFILLIVALWLRPARIVVLGLSLPVLILWGLFLHPVLPLTVGVAALALIRPKNGEAPLAEMRGGRLSAVGALLACLLALGQFVPGLRVSAGLIAQGVGLQQSWNRSYPLAAENVVEVVAQDSRTKETFWSLDGGSSRRARLWADQVGRDSAWTSRLEDALKHRFVVESGPAIWLKLTGLEPNQALGLTEVQLLTKTPVQGLTRGRRVR
jgi:hypothetical protein